MKSAFASLVAAGLTLFAGGCQDRLYQFNGTIAPISSVTDSRMTFIIRSVPMFPEPTIATFVFIRISF